MIPKSVAIDVRLVVISSRLNSRAIEAPPLASLSGGAFSSIENIRAGAPHSIAIELEVATIQRIPENRRAEEPAGRPGEHFALDSR